MLPRRSSRSLLTSTEVVDAGLAGEVLVATLDFSTARYLCTLEYPIKTCNFNERDGVFQPDTGPVLFPTRLDVELEEIIDHVELAFVAWNGYAGSPLDGDWAEFIIRTPTDIGNGVKVQHYSRSVTVACKNTMHVFVDD